MCGIVAVVAKHSTFSYYIDALFTNLVAMDSIRGDDSTGVFGITKDGKCDIVKGNADGYLFTRTKEFENFVGRSGQYRIMVGHNRAATIGNVTAENAHPFQQKHITLVHNGTIHNKTDLNKEVEVDSHAIAHALADHDAVQALGKIDGAYALVWWDSSDKTLNLARNDKRPLFLLEFETFWAISSEAGLPIWLNRREGRQETKVILVPTEKILSIKLDQRHKGWFEIPYEEYKGWVSTYAWPDASTASSPQQPTVIQEPKSNVVKLAERPKNSDVLKYGDTVIFKLVDSNAEGVGEEVLIGHPLFDGEIDSNIVVRAVLPKGTTQEELLVYFGHEYYTGTVQYFRNVAGVMVAYLNKDFAPYELIKDQSGTVSNASEITEAIKAGCGKCKKAMTLDDAKNGIARKKKDKTWRLVCPSCLNDTITQVQQAKPGVKLRLATN